MYTVARLFKDWNDSYFRIIFSFSTLQDNCLIRMVFFFIEDTEKTLLIKQFFCSVFRFLQPLRRAKFL